MTQLPIWELWILEGHRSREVGLLFIMTMKLTQTLSWSKILFWELKEMGRRLTEMVLGFSSFCAEKPYFMVVVGIFEVSLKTSDTQRRKERTFADCCSVLGTVSHDSMHIVWFHWSYWALVSQVFPTYKMVDENSEWQSHRMACCAAFQGHVSE